MRGVIRFGLAFLLCSCGDDAGPSSSPDAGASSGTSGATADCNTLAPLKLEAKPARVRTGGSVTLTATGGSGSYAFSVIAGGSGGALDGNRFVAGTTPAVETFAVTDTKCSGETRASSSVVGPFRVTPSKATVRPATTFTIVTEGVLGKAVFELLSSSAASTVDADGHYIAGPNDGRDVIDVRDDVGGDKATLSYDVRTGALLEAPYPRIALPSGSSVPLIATGGSDTVVWEKVSGAGTVQGDRFAFGSDLTTARVRGTDAFTKDVVELDLKGITSIVPVGPSSDGLGASVALAARGAGAVAAIGAPGFQGGLGRAYAYDPATGIVSVGFEGAASPLHRGRRVGGGVAFTDFNGDGRTDLVAGAPELVVPTNAVRATEVTPYYATDRAACVPATAPSNGGVLVSLGQADGSFKPAYRLWNAVAGAGDLGFEVAGAFDFNGDGKADIAARRGNGLDIFLGRAPDDASLAKLTMGCDPPLSIPKLPAPAVALASLGDIDGDSCDDIAVSYRDATHGGALIAFGYDVGGTRCGGRTTPATIRFSADAETGEVYLGLGTAITNAGRFLGGSTRWLAIGASQANVGGVVRPGIILVDLSALAALRMNGAAVVTGLAQSGVTTHVLATSDTFSGFGQSLRGGVDLTGDGTVDLVVGAPAAAFAAPGSGAAFVFAGGASSTGVVRPYLLVSGDDGASAGLGHSLALLPTLLVVGSPTSTRNGVANGAAYLLPLP